MSAILFSATVEHECEWKHCPKARKIAVGEKAVKATARRSNCGASYIVTVYYHEECYQSKGGRHGKRN